MRLTPNPDGIADALKKAAGIFTRSGLMDRESFSQLLAPVKEPLYNFILKALNFSEDADDLYQDAVLRAFRYRKSYRPEHAFKTWIFTVAHNEIKRYFNRHKNTPSSLDLMEHIYVTDDNQDEEKVRVIYEIASQLNPRQRNVFFLFYDHGFSLKEISGITGLKEGNIKFILNRARETIKKTLKKEGNHE